MARMRVLLYAHDGMGSAHLRGVAHLANTLRQEFSTLVLSGLREAARIVPQACGLIKLPDWEGLCPAEAERASQETWIDLTDEQALEMRSRAILDAAELYRPDALLVGHWPLGRHNELQPLLETLACPRYLVHFGGDDVADGLMPRGDATEGVGSQYDRIFVASADAAETDGYREEAIRLIIARDLATGFRSPGAMAQLRAAGRPIVNLDDFRTAARDKIGPDLFDYIDGGAGDELTCEANRCDLDTIRLAPLVFRDVAQVDLRWSGPLGDFALPIGLGPSAMHRLVHERGELATASAANTMNVPMIASMMASCAMEETATHSRHNALWLQTYVLKDRVLGTELIRRAERAGFKAIVVSAGCPVMGKRDRNLANGFTLPRTVSAANFRKTDALDHNNPIHSFDGAAPDPGVTWRDLEDLIAETALPVVIKGIINAADVAPALASGAAALIVSNHGGRQLDGTMSTICALPDVVDAVAGRVPVLIDGGIRRGIDVVKALALGADAVLLGRTVMWALAAGGERGLTSALEILADEFANALRLVGCATIAELRANASAILR